MIGLLDGRRASTAMSRGRRSWPSSRRCSPVRATGWTTSCPCLAALLGVPTGVRYPALALTPEVQKRRTLQALVDQLVALAARQPVLALYEDVHWIDPVDLDSWAS